MRQRLARNFCAKRGGKFLVGKFSAAIEVNYRVTAALSTKSLFSE
jgi:hypothetical protein